MDPKKTAERIQSQVGSYLSDFSGQSEPHRDVLSGSARGTEELHRCMDEIDSGEATVNTLAHSYKHTRHAAPAVLWKYLAHRVNHIDGYDSSHQGHMLDHIFMATVGADGASEENHLVTPRHLNNWLMQNPQLVEEALTHKQECFDLASHNSGLNVRRINGEPYVAMTQGLDTEHLGRVTPLASFCDRQDSGYGSFQHHIWMPLSDLWHSYPASPGRYPNGHENEWVFSNSAQRYLATGDDVKTSYYSAFPSHLAPEVALLGGLEDEGASKLIEAGRVSPDFAVGLHQLGLLGPKALAAQAAAHGYHTLFADHPALPKDLILKQALSGEKNHSLIAYQNPSLEAEDLKTIVTSATFPISPSHPEAVVAISRHPSFNESVGAALVDRIMAPDEKSPQQPETLLSLMAQVAQSPCLALHRALIEGLDQGEECAWMPAQTVARCFLGPANAPQAFNNTKNSERYLRALNDYFEANPDLEDPASVYGTMLSGARLDDTTLSTLTDLVKSGQSMPNVATPDFHKLMADLAAKNPHLTPRQVVNLATVPECLSGLLARSQPLPPSAQTLIASFIDERGAREMVRRPDFCKEAADVLLRRFKDTDEVWPSWVSRNPRIPVGTIEKHLDHESSAQFANALGFGLDERNARPKSDILPVPPGGIE